MGLNIRGNLASLNDQQRFAELFELASKEEDQDKVGALFEEILRLLESQTMLHDRATPNGQLHSAVASA